MLESPPRLKDRTRLFLDRSRSRTPLKQDQGPALILDPFTVTLIRIRARQLCRRSDFSRSDYDDLRQSMRLYLLQKAHLFDPSRGNREAFITQVINTWTAIELRFRRRDKRRRASKAVSLERTTVEFDGDITTLGAVLLEEDGQRLTQTVPLPTLEQFELREAIVHAMRHIQPADRAIVIHVVRHGVASAARTFGTSRRQVLKALARARLHFEKAGLGTD